MLVNRLKKSHVGEYLLSEIHAVESAIMPCLISDEQYVKHYYKKYSGKKLNLNNPVTFSEKLNWYKLNKRNPLMQQCADKIAVRDYVASKGYGDCLNQVLRVYSDVHDILIDDLPERFVLKASHGSHMNIIVKDNKEQINWRFERRMMRSWLHQNIYWSGREWVYKDLPRRIIAEKYIEDETGELRDYKFFCFNGEPRFVQVESERFGKHHSRNFYDMDWKLMPFGKGMPHNPDLIVSCPHSFEQMKKMAVDLSEPFDFVRVDLYQLRNKIIFGEMTFFPAGGKPDFIPEEYDLIIGKMWR